MLKVMCYLYRVSHSKAHEIILSAKITFAIMTSTKPKMAEACGVQASGLSVYLVQALLRTA